MLLDPFFRIALTLPYLKIVGWGGDYSLISKNLLSRDVGYGTPGSVPAFATGVAPYRRLVHRVMPLKFYRLLGLVLMLLLKLVLIALDLGLCMQKGCLYYSSWAHER